MATKARLGTWNSIDLEFRIEHFDFLFELRRKESRHEIIHVDHVVETT